MLLSKSYRSQFKVLFLREWHVYKKRVFGLLLNFVVLQSFTFAFVQGYIKPLMYFGLPIDRRGLMVFAGSLIFLFIRRSFDFATAYFNDIHVQKHIWYQRTAAPYSAVYGSRVLFSTLFVAALIAAFLPMPKIILGSSFDVSHIRWGIAPFVTILTAAMFTTYAYFCFSFVTSRESIARVRVRLNEVLMWMGAFNATWFAMYTSHRVFGYVSLLSPFTYATESFRHVLYTGSDLIPLSVTMSAMCCWSLAFYLAGLWLFKKKVVR